MIEILHHKPENYRSPYEIVHSKFTEVDHLIYFHLQAEIIVKCYARAIYEI